MMGPFFTETVIMAAAVAITAIADVLTTVRGLDRGAYEANPVMRWLMGVMGVLPALVASKGVLVGGVTVAAFLYWTEWYTPVGFGVLAFFQGIVAFINYRGAN
jgi:hypothetical protein